MFPSPFVLAALVTLACGSAPTSAGPARRPVDDGSRSAPAFTVGTGKDQFVALADGAPVEIIHGPQGGYHIWGALRVTGVASGPVDVTYTVSLDTEPRTPLSSTSYSVDPFARAGGREWAGLIGYVPDPAVAANRSVVLSMILTDAAGLMLSDERHVVAGPVPP